MRRALSASRARVAAGMVKSKQFLIFNPNQTMSKDIKDLVSLIDMRGLECLNEQTGHSIKNAIEEVRSPILHAGSDIFQRSVLKKRLSVKEAF